MMNKEIIAHMVYIFAAIFICVTVGMLIGATFISCKKMDETALDEAKKIQCPGVLESAKIAEMSGIELTAGEQQLVKDCEGF